MDWPLLYTVAMIVLMLPLLFAIVVRRRGVRDAIPQMLLAIVGAAIGIVGSLATKVFTEGNYLYLIPATSGILILVFATRLILRTRRRNLRHAGTNGRDSAADAQDKRSTALDLRVILYSAYVSVGSVFVAIVGSIVAASITG